MTPTTITQLVTADFLKYDSDIFGKVSCPLPATKNVQAVLQKIDRKKLDKECLGHFPNLKKLFCPFWVNDGLGMYTPRPL